MGLGLTTAEIQHLTGQTWGVGTEHLCSKAGPALSSLPGLKMPVPKTTAAQPAAQPLPDEHSPGHSSLEAASPQFNENQITGTHR